MKQKTIEFFKEPNMRMMRIGQLMLSIGLFKDMVVFGISAHIRSFSTDMAGININIGIIGISIQLGLKPKT